MRTGRLISMVSALQERGRMTAADLASELDVSVRTVLRDVETLSAAGVPIYTVQGAGGGIHLLGTFDSALTTMSSQEAAGVLLAGEPELAGALGLAAAARAARATLLRTLGPARAAAAIEIDDWFLHDPLGRGAPSNELVRDLARAVRARVEVELAGGPSGWLRPLGLVLEAGSWHLVHLSPSGPQLLALTGSLPESLPESPPDSGANCRLGRRFNRPDDFDLAAFWRGLPR